jgi:hypothetical protein
VGVEIEKPMVLAFTGEASLALSSKQARLGLELDRHDLTTFRFNLRKAPLTQLIFSFLYLCINCLCHT